jgi:ATP-dependent Clp protease ATP-binding subunit ClpA
VFESFTNLAKRSITLAQDEAMQLGHDFIGTEHILLGVARVQQGLAWPLLADAGATPERLRAETVQMLAAVGITGTASQDAADALAAIGIDVAEIQRRADDTFGPGRFRFPRPPFTSRAKRSLGYAVREAHALGQADVGPEHLLLGLLADADAHAQDPDTRHPSGALTILTTLGADPVTLRAAILTRATAAAP